MRRRYLILELGGGVTEESLKTLLGEKLLPLRPGLALLRCSHLQVEEFKRMLSLEGVRVLGVSGTMKGARRLLARKGHERASHGEGRWS